jgi:hypothetical protein
MVYAILRNGKVIHTEHNWEEANDLYLAYRTNNKQNDIVYDLQTLHYCKSCNDAKLDSEERFDFHGISTGYYCTDCFQNNYPYRQDDYMEGQKYSPVDGTPLDYD